MTKSHVSMEQAVCVVCGKVYDTGAILFDRRLKESLESHTVTHVGGFCDPCKKLKEEGYIAIVGAIEPPNAGDTIQPGEADRTGDVVHVRESAWSKIFNCSVPQGGVSFAPPEVIELLKSKVDWSSGWTRE